MEDDEPKKLSHRQKQRASRRIKKKEERKLIKKEKKKDVSKDDNVKSKLKYYYQLKIHNVIDSNLLLSTSLIKYIHIYIKTIYF